MPQVDKASFFPIVFWTLILYVGGYLVLNLSVLFLFFARLKVSIIRNFAVHQTALQRRHSVNRMTFFPWLSL